MKKIIYLIIMLPMVLTIGCASKSDYSQIRVEFEHLKRDLNNQNSKLYNDISSFKEAYNPDLQDRLSDNLSAAEKYRKSIERTQRDVENISAKMDGLLRESEKDRMLISENLRTSRAQNVVNEFRRLNKEWDAAINQLTILLHNSERAAASSQQAAIQAAEKAGSAERSAHHASQSTRMIEEQRRSLRNIREKLRNIEMQISKLNKKLDDIDEPEKPEKPDKPDKPESRHRREKEAPEKH